MRLSSPKISSPNFFGFAEHGNFESKDTITYLDVPDDDGPCYYFFNNFIVNAGHTVTIKRPCRGLYIFVSDTSHVAGIVTMNLGGIYSPPVDEYANGYIPMGMHSVLDVNGINSEYSLPGVLASGGVCNNAGSSYSPSYTYTNGGTGVNGGCGGGGSGNGHSAGWGHNSGGVYAPGGNGGMAGVFSGGASGAGGAGAAQGGLSPCSGTIHPSTLNAQDYGGAGGYGYGSVCGATGIISKSGQGNPGKKSTYSSTIGWHAANDSTITGLPGVLYFITNNIYMPGSLTANGVDPVSSSWAATTYRKNAGGSGGGSITLLYRNNLLHNDLSFQVSCNGGSHAGNGSKRIQQIL